MLKKMSKCKLLITLLLLLCLVAGYCKKEVYAKTDQTVHEVMELTGILKDEDGNSILHSKYATRAEFARIIVQASGNAEKALQTNHLQLFSDVSKKNKYASYIQLAVTNSYMSGYLNGKFNPKKAVTYKEAVYGILALLGYTNDDFSGQIAGSRYTKFSELGLAKNLSLDSNDKLTKSDCEILCYNLLHAKQKSGDIYGKTLGFSYDSNNRIDYQAMFTLKTKGPVLTQKGWSNILSQDISKYTILKDNSKISPSAIKENSIAYYAEQTKTIWIYDEKIYGTVESISYNQGEPSDITISGSTYLLENNSTLKNTFTKNKIKKGSLVVLLLGRNDKVSLITPIQSMVASTNWTSQLTFSLAKGQLYRNNVESTVSAIENQDVIYYSNELKTVWAFHQRIFGALNDITTVQGDPSELKVSGTTYTVGETKKVKEHLKSASIQTKMPVVLILGWDNTVYDILPLSSCIANDWNANLSFPLNQGTIYKNGSTIQSDKLNPYDVMYYSKELNTAWVYDSKAYGVLKSISPNISMPDSIVVAGKTYNFDQLPINSNPSLGNDADNLSQNQWSKRLQSRGIKEGDYVVVLFGFQGSIADILPIEKMSLTITGYVLKLDNQIVKNGSQISSVQPVLQMVDTQGNLREFPCYDTSIRQGMIVEVSFNNGQQVIKSLTNSGITVPYDITSKKIASNAHILQVKNQYFTVLNQTQLSDITWGQGNVLYYSCNTLGEITELVLYQTPGSSYQYGIVKDLIIPNFEDNFNFQYVFSFGETETTLSTDSSKWSTTLLPKAVLIDNNQIQDMHDLTEVRISYISNLQANTGVKVYWIADDVSVYFYKNGKYYSGNLSDITNFTTSTVKGYRDTQGPIRIIIVNQ
jgi:hypothetical protein